MKQSKQSFGFLETPKQPKVVAEHDNGIEGVGWKAIELFDREHPRILHATLAAQANRQRGRVDGGDVQALALKVERHAARATPHIKCTRALRKSHGLLFVACPGVEILEVALRPVARGDEAVVAFGNFIGPAFGQAGP